jgi:Protein of unknown function (DUF1501)
MFRVASGGSGRKYCDGFSRRSFVQLGVAGMASASLADVLRAKEESLSPARPQKNTSVILIWLDGGPGHLDTYDMKPNAPSGYRGIWRPIRTNVAGIEISELFPLQAKVADKFSIVRSLHHGQGDHFTAGHFMLTSRGGPNGAATQGKNPSLGSIATKITGPRKPGMPAYIAVPYASSIGLRPGYFGANYLGLEHSPFESDGDPNDANFQVNNLRLADGLTIERLEDRKQLNKLLDQNQRQIESRNQIELLDRFQHKAFELVVGNAGRKAFDISQESPELRDRYGRNTWGQSTLLARRLVEAGATFVTVHLGGWDHHWDLQKGMEDYLPKVDRLVATLFEDLSSRGLLDQVLVVLCGEFSRTPLMNNGGNGGPPLSMGTPGRDHWGNAMFCLLGGGGVKGGQIVGATTDKGETPKERAVTPGDIHATIYHVLGVDPSVNFLDHSGRPVPALDYGIPIAELI